MAKGLFIGNSHANGGIPSEIAETGTKIEIEGNEYYICNEAYNSTNYFDFKKKTNKEILDFIYTEFACKLDQNVMHSGDFIVCKVVVADKKKKDRKGTIRDILNEMQGEKNCKVETGSDYLKEGGELIKRADGTNTTFDSNNPDIRYEQGNLITPKEMEKPIFDFMKSSPMQQARAITALEKKIRSNDKVMPIYQWIEGFDKNLEVGTSKIYSSKSEKGYTEKLTIGNHIVDYKAEQDYYKYLQSGGESYSSFLDKKQKHDAIIKAKEDAEKEERNKKREEENKKREQGYRTAKNKTIKRFIEEGKGLILKEFLLPFQNNIKNLEKKPKTTANEKEIAYNERMIEQTKEQVEKSYKIASKLYKIVDGEVVKKYEWKVGDKALYDGRIETEIINVDKRVENDIENVTYKVEKKEGIYNQYIGYDGLFPIESETELEKPVIGNVFADLVLDRLEKAFKQRFPNDKFEREALIKIWNETKNERDENRANNNLQNTLMSYFDDDLRRIIYSDIVKEAQELEKGIKVEQEHLKTFEKVAAGHITPEQAIKETAEEHIAENPNYYDELEKIEKKPNSKEPMNINESYYINRQVRGSGIDRIIISIAKNDDPEKIKENIEIVMSNPNFNTAEKWEQQNNEEIYKYEEKINEIKLDIEKWVKTGGDYIKKLPEYEKKITDIEALNKLIEVANSIKDFNSLSMYLDKKESEIKTDIESYKNPYQINKAIEKLLDQKRDSDNYSAKELEFISYYSGYGGLEKFGEIGVERMKGLMYEFYTPDAVVKKMWALAYKYGYGTIADNSVFEPSVGIGAFLKYAPKDVRLVANEINEYSAKICEILYPNAKVELKYFEQNFIKNNLSIKHKTENLDKYSLIIGNPPYGTLNSKYVAMGEDKFTHAANYTEYFISRGLDLLVKDGLLVYIVGAEQYNGGSLFLDSGLSKVKEIIFDKADLLDAYRLPINIFERTGVSSEIVVFKKR